MLLRASQKKIPNTFHLILTNLYLYLIFPSLYEVSKIQERNKVLRAIISGQQIRCNPLIQKILLCSISPDEIIRREFKMRTSGQWSPQRLKNWCSSHKCHHRCYKECLLSCILQHAWQTGTRCSSPLPLHNQQ